MVTFIQSRNLEIF